MNCPICNKSGLPDYTIKPVICPQCNSDLKGFALLEQTNSVYKKTVKKYIYTFSMIFVFVVIGYSALVLIPSKTTNKLQPIVNNSDSIINILKEELQVKELEINKLQSSVEDPNETSFIYIVKSGDNLSKIAYIFYNDWKLYKKIEKDNNLEHGSILLPKDTLIINLKTK